MSQNNITINDIIAKQDIYNNFPNISKEEKKKAINDIIMNKRGLKYNFAKNKKLLRLDEVKAFLVFFGIEIC